MKYVDSMFIVQYEKQGSKGTRKDKRQRKSEIEGERDK